ncbi:hypothetical protein [Bradyrhizobium sp. 150]|uniref:hypothetical protein n=1 Tax=Bradyrhizobium sp. 150 TaxID=2782625 RepID=UPI001FF7FEE6|nr:hypothetical protein [Bradyrhizobium sp. 150]MCK1671089.1 hypothetical protein [Bradyrhizobium sp. 150]
MSVFQVTDSDIVAAARVDDVDAAVLTLQNIAGIDDGGVASICFSGFDWAAASNVERIHQLHAWLRVERAYEEDEQ